MSNMQKMFNSNAMMDRFFRRAENVVWDMMTGKTGIKTKEGIVTLEISGAPGDEEFQPVENPFDQMAMAIPAFAQRTSMDAVKVGDMILKGTMTAWVTKVNAKSVSIIKPDGTQTTWTPPKTQILDFGSGVMVVRSLFNMMPGGQAGVGGMAGMLMPMMMSGMMDEEGMEKIIPMMLMMGGAMTTNGNPADTAASPMASMMGGQNMGQMFQTMMMMEMFKKMSGGSGGMFGGGAKKPQATDEDWEDRPNRTLFRR